MRDSQKVQPARKSIDSRYRSALVAFVFGAIVAVCGPLSAQTAGTGALSGLITDPSAAAVVGAEVKVTEVSTGYNQTVRTNGQGQYRASLLPPGTYTVQVTRTGFKVAAATGVQVVVAESTVQNVQMAVGAITETVTVASQALELQTQSSLLGRVTDAEMVEDLPLVTRNYTQIVALNPGVSQELNNAGQMGRGGSSQPGRSTGGSIISQGGTSVDNNFEMNGLPVDDIQSSAGFVPGIPVPNPDTIEEFRVQTAMFDATSGRNAGADVDVITKGGTNDLHGSVFEFFRNEALDANEWFQKKNGQRRQVLRENQYGFTAGGPVIKDKLLFFGSYQGTRQTNGVDASNRKTDYLPPLTNDRSLAGLGATFAGDAGYLGAAFGTIAANGSNISPQAAALLQLKLPNGQYLVPTPQTIDKSRSLEIQGTASLSFPGFYNENQFVIDGDYLRSDRNKIQVRYFEALSNQESTTLFSTEGFPLFTPQRFDVGSVGQTFVISPTLVNQLLVGMHRSTSRQKYNNAFTFSSLGISVPALEDAFPNIYIAYTGFETGTSSALSFFEEEYNLTDALSWSKGKHQLTFGGGYGYGRDHMQNFDYEAYVIPLTWADLLLGQSYAAYGVPYSNIYESADSVGDKTRDWRYKDADAYVQDNYAILKRLTLNLGLRYEHLGDLGDAKGLSADVNSANINPNPGAGGSYNGYEVASNYSGGIGLPTGVVKTGNTFGMSGQGQDLINPRLGFAYILPGSQNVVFRGGAGLYHSTTVGQLNVQLAAEQPFGEFRTLIGSQNGFATIAKPFADPPPIPGFTPYTSSTTQTMDTLRSDFRPGSTYHYSLGVQAKIPGGAVLDVAYSGARALHLVLGRTINQANLASPSNPIRGQTKNTVANVPLRSPYLGWTTATMYEFGSQGQAWYNSMQASLSQHYKDKLQYQAAYTWTRLLTPVPGYTIGTNAYGPAGDQNHWHTHDPGYGPEPFIRPNRFVLSALYHLPSPRNAHSFLGETLGGWVASTVFVAQDGPQLSIGYTNTNSVYGISSDRASYAVGCDKNGVATPGNVEQRLNNYINAKCFTAPAAAMFNSNDDPTALGFGNTPTGILKGPGQYNADISVIKAWQLTWPKDGANVQFRTDFFNATNHPNFASPSTGFAVGSSSFGVISSTLGNPRIMQFALRLAF
ncbi:MAG: carboxypeptidase regulatory-like domain-containing protein [Acidobacteriota bacterium]